MRSDKIAAFIFPSVLLVSCIAALARTETAAQKPQGESSRTSRGERTLANGELAEPARMAAGARSKPLPLAALEMAMTRNDQLRADLPWTFGGKGQRGWEIYAPLVGNLIGCDCEAESIEFAEQVFLWQEGQGIEPTGALDAGTWLQMVAVFQSRRLIHRGRPPVNELVTIPISECYDPERPEDLRRADGQTLAAYRQMVAAATSDPSLGLETTGEGRLAPGEKFLKIISAYRSREYQDQLRRQSPSSGRAGLAINSPHFTGRAIDLYVGGEPVNTKDENRMVQTRTKVYRWLVRNASRFGFQPYFFEPWHWEYVGAADAGK